MQRVHDLGRYLDGSWTLQRTIVGGDRAPWGTLSGHASFRRVGDSVLLYVEEGRLLMGGHRGVTRQRLRYDVLAGAATVYFDDGRIFHHLDLGIGECRMEHRCGNDFYSGHAVIEGPARWRMIWTIEGPAKRATIISYFDRDA